MLRRLLEKYLNLTKNELAKKIDSLAEDLPNPDTAKMRGNNPFHKVRVGDYRIVYEIQDDILVIMIIKIGHRKDVYRNLY